MAYKNLISPEFRLDLGKYILEDGIMVEYVSSADAHADWARINLDEELIGSVMICSGDEYSVDLGYEDEYANLLTGTIEKDQTPDWKEIIVKDDYWKLEACYVCATFVKCTPQDIVRYLLTQAGITNYELSVENYRDTDRFVVENKKASEVLKMLNTFYGISVDYYFRNGIFYWGCRPEQKDIYVLDEENNILDMEMYGSMWCADTVGIPWIHHSDIIEVEHTLYTGYAQAKKIVIKRDEKGFIRQSIYFVPVEEEGI